jgi:hypothetical protein
MNLATKYEQAPQFVTECRPTMVQVKVSDEKLESASRALGLRKKRSASKVTASLQKAAREQIEWSDH